MDDTQPAGTAAPQAQRAPSGTPQRCATGQPDANSVATSGYATPAGDVSGPPTSRPASAALPAGTAETRTRRPSQAETTVHTALGSLAAQVGAMRQHLPHVDGLQQCVLAADQALHEVNEVCTGQYVLVDE